MTPRPIIDLHLHTTASDGRLTPGELILRAATKGVTVMAVTDHDTTAAVIDAQALGRAQGIDVIPGIEVTAVERGGDVHVLGYFFRPEDVALNTFLAEQRARRVTRVENIIDRLEALGLPVDGAALLEDARRQQGRAIGRPQVARAMVAAGHVGDVGEAFDRWLGRGRPAFVAREGPPIVTVLEVLHAAGGLASLAHPGKSRIDEHIEALRDAGLDALEVYHPDHDAADRARYAGLAARLRLLATGGSDFHGEPSHGVEPGTSSLPEPAWLALLAASRRHA